MTDKEIERLMQECLQGHSCGCGAPLRANCDYMWEYMAYRVAIYCNACPNTASSMVNGFWHPSDIMRLVKNMHGRIQHQWERLEEVKAKLNSLPLPDWMKCDVI